MKLNNWVDASVYANIASFACVRHIRQRGVTLLHVLPEVHKSNKLWVNHQDGREVCAIREREGSPLEA